MSLSPAIHWNRPAGRARGIGYPRRALVGSPQALPFLSRGFARLARALTRTLGPAPRLVLNTSLADRNEIECLLDSATIATRLIELPDRRENVGAMALRGMVQQIHEHYGDGAATAAVLAHEMVRGGLKLIAAGFNPALLRRGLERGIPVAIQALAAQAQSVEDEEMLARLACGVTGTNEELGRILGEIFATLGENTSLLVEEQPAPFLDRAYLAGGQWAAAPGSYLLIPDGKAALELQQPLILLSDDNLETVAQVQPALELALSLPDKPPLLVIARHVLGEALNTLMANHTRGVLTVGIALLQTGVKMITDDLGDLARLTGGQVMARELGQPPERIKLEYLGRARKVVLTRKNLLIVDGAGDPRQVRERIAQVRAQLKRLPRGEDEWQKQRLRLGRLSGGIGVVKLGASSERERTFLREQVERATLVLDLILEEGAVPGGGVAYLNCIEAVESAARTCTHPDEAAGMRLIAQALPGPFVQIVRNHGRFSPSLVLDEARRRGPDYGFDARDGEIAPLAERGILDGLAVARAALESAASLAAMLLTVDALILRD